MSIRSLYNEARQALGAASDDPAFEAACCSAFSAWTARRC